MTEALYFYFYKRTHIDSLSIMLAYIARVVFFVKFLFQRAVLKKESFQLSFTDALNILRETSPEPVSEISYDMEELDPSIDLSIVIPVYNHLAEIGECINSVLAQKTTYRYELILVDDGSTDGAEKYIERYIDNPAVRIIRQENMGIAGARNTGIASSRGRYIMFVDCDDSTKSNMVEDLMRAAYEQDCDIAMGAHNLVKKKNGTVTEVVPNIYPRWNLSGYKNNDTIMNYAGYPWAKVYKRELFEQVRYFPGYWYEDTIVHSLLFPQCRVFSYIPVVVYDYYWYEYNFSHTQSNKTAAKNKSIDRYWLIRAIVKRYEEIGLPKDAMFYTMLLKHLSAYYLNTTYSLPEHVIQALFVCGRELLLENKPKEKVRLPYMLRLTEKAMINGDIALWKLCSVNQ